MKSFREWRATSKSWKAQKEQIMQHWENLPPGRPMAELRTIPPNHKGSTLSYDGVRISGSSNFIDAVISRLKDLLPYEGNGTYLQVIYKQQINSHTEQPVPESYVFYLQFKQGVDPSIAKPKLIKPAKPLQ